MWWYPAFHLNLINLGFRFQYCNISFEWIAPRVMSANFQRIKMTKFIEKYQTICQFKLDDQMSMYNDLDNKHTIVGQP
jgi:hypothetical protein